jgi:hypothetical protein
VTRQLNAPVVRRIAWAVALTPAAVVSLAAAPALADPPDTWARPDKVSPLHVLLVLGAIPLGLFVLITLAVYLPSMIRGERYQPGLAWRNEPEWFGGPSAGVAAADKTSHQQIESDKDRGGASANW